MILLTGGSGSIGKHVSADLRLKSRFPLADLDIDLPRRLSETSTLIHLAGVSDSRLVNQDPNSAYLINVDSTIALLQSFAKNGGKRFVFSSTGHVYGGTKPGSYSVETDPVNPKSEYAEQKVIAENLLKELSIQLDIQLIILRIFSVFGLGMRQNYLAGNIENFFESQKRFPIVQTSDDIRDFSTPETVAKYINMTANLAIQSSFTVNICTGHPVSVRERVKEAFDSFPEENFLPGNSEMPYLVGSTDQMRKRFV